ncbi:hypothetical protein ES703_112109 [subsurface metagenome]
MGMKVVLFTDSECPPCDDAAEAMKEYIEKEEVEIMDIHEGLRQYDLGEPEGVPFLGVISPSTGKCINKVFFQDIGVKEITPEAPSQGESEPGKTDQETEQHGETAEE